MLETDEKEHNLSYNQRNCVIYRKGEKEILHFYKDFSDYVLNLLTMNYKEAKTET